MNGLAAILAGFLAFYSAHEVSGLFLFILLEEAGLPLLLPGDTLIMAAARKGPGLTGALLVILTAVLAASLGSSLLYGIVRRGGRPFIDRYGRFLHLTEKRVTRMEGWFEHHGTAAIIVGRLAPGLRMPTSVMAGLFGVPYRVFVPATVVAAAVWSTLYFGAGLLLRHEWTAISDAMTDIDNAAAIAVGLLLVVVLTGGIITWRCARNRLVVGLPARWS